MSYVLKDVVGAKVQRTLKLSQNSSNNAEGSVEDKILVPKPPKNYARCAKCGHPVNGPYCQGCALLREKLEEDLVSYLKYFHDASDSSDDSTNVVNAPREPFIVKQDHGVKSSQNPPPIDKLPCVSKPNFVDESSNIFNPSPQHPKYSCEFCGSNAQYGHYCTPQAPFNNPKPGYSQDFNFPQSKKRSGLKKNKRLVLDIGRFTLIDDYDYAITPEETDNSLIMGDEHLDIIPATKSDEVIKSSVEDLVPIPSEFEGIPDTMYDVHLVNNSTPLEAKDHFEIVINSNNDISSGDDDSLYNKNIEYVEASPHDSELVSLEAVEIVIPEVEAIEDDNLREKLLNGHLLIANIKALKDNPTPSSEFLAKSSTTSLNSFLEETNTFHNSLPKFENFYFDLGEINSGSTTTHSDISLPDYEAFYFDDDHVKEISSGSTTTHSDISLSKYDSFIFDFTHEEFADELAHFISPSEYDCFYFWILPDPGELMFVLNSGIRKNLSFTTSVNLPIEDDHSPLLAYVVWIFVAYLTYPVIPLYLHPFRNEDTLFDPGITINHFYSSKPSLSHRYRAFKKFNTYRSHLNEWPMIINGKNTLISDVLLLLHLAGSQPMLKSSYKAEASVIISIPPLVGGVADVVVEIKGTGRSISITFWFSMGLQTPDDLSRSRLGFIKKIGVFAGKEINKVGEVSIIWNPLCVVVIWSSLEKKSTKLVKYRSSGILDDENATNPSPVLPTPQAPHTISTIKLSILKKGVSTEDANQKFLRSLPSSWSQVPLIMRTKPGVDTLSFDDLYNNLRVFESDVKGSTVSSSSIQNVAFVSSNNTNITNEVSTTYGVSTSSGHNSQKEGYSSYTDDLMYSFFANQSSGPQLDHEGLKQTQRKLHFDAKEPVGFDKTKVECFSCHNTGHFARECRLKENQESRKRDTRNNGYKARDNRRRPVKQDEHKAMVTIDREGVDWTGHAEDDTENYALMAFNSSNLGSDTEVTSCSKVCEESYAKLKKLYDEQREQLGVASIEIQAYTLALKKIEAQLVCHQKNQLAYEEKIRFMKIDLDNKTNVLIYYKKLLAEAEKEKEELKTKLTIFQSSSKGLNKLLNSQMSAKDKSGLEYGNQIHEGVLSYENEVLESVFDSRSSEVKDIHVNDRFAEVEGMHAVPPPITGIYMPLKYDFRIDESKFTYGLKQSKTSESKNNNIDSCESNSSVETLEYVPKLVESKPKAVSEPKVWSATPIIEEYESDNDDEYVFKAPVEQEKPSCAFTVKHVKTPSFSHLIRDYDFHEKKMAKQVELNKRKNKDNPHQTSKRKGIVDSGCSRHIIRNKAYLIEYQDFNGGLITFGGTQDNINAGNSDMEAESVQEYFVLPLWSSYTSTVKSSEAKNGDEKLIGDTAKTLRKTFAKNIEDLLLQAGAARANSTNNIPSLEDVYEVPNDGIFTSASYDDEGAVADYTNLESIMNIEPKKISQALKDESWVDAMQEELLQFKTQQVWILVDLPFEKKTASTLIETKKPLVKDAKAADVDVYLYRSIIGSLMYLTASRPDIMYAVCACSRFQVTPKTSHLQAMKRIFRYLKGQSKLGLWSPRESVFNLEAYSYRDYAGTNLDRKSTTAGPVSPKMRSLGKEYVSKQGRKKDKTGTNIKEGTNYVVNEGSYTDKVKMINAEAKGVSAVESVKRRKE
nr:hypothetical protein [Tanacetum cinerariifolium]